MKLKFYLIGFGMGALLATAILIISGGFNKTTMTDEEVMARARQLGMVEASSRLIDSNSQGLPNAAATNSSTMQAGSSNPENTAPGETSGEVSSSEDASASAASGEEGTQGLSGASDSIASSDNFGGSEDTEETGQESAQAGQSSSSGSEKSEQSTGAGTSTGTGTASAQVIVTVPDGLYSEQVSELLQQAGAVDDATAFNNYLIQSGRDRYITPGAKLIPGGATYEEVARILSGR